jgi:nucleotide-binding universal stress UspA family protein
VDPELTSAAGEPGHEIVEVARRVQAKTIVLGEHHHGFLAKLFGATSPPACSGRLGCTVILARAAEKALTERRLRSERRPC